MPRIRSLPAKKDVVTFIERLSADGTSVTSAQVRKLRVQLNRMVDYQPKVGVFGKTGAGKSSLCNALFGKKVAKVGDVKACTRSPQKVLVGLTPDGAGMTLIDVPGVGESEERDDEYFALYEKLLPQLDVVLWVLKGDDRAYSVDQRFYKEVVLPAVEESGVPVIFVVNQADLIKPVREWDEENRQPGPKQRINIKAKVDDVKRIFKVSRKVPVVVPVSADELYNLDKLVETIVGKLPDEKKVGFAREVRDEHLSTKAEKEVAKGFWNSVKEIAGKVLLDVLPSLISAGIKKLLTSW